ARGARRRRAGGRASPRRRLPCPRSTAARRVTMPIRVLLVDDQALMRAGFRMILESEDDLEVVGEAGNGYEALELARRTRPDVVLMDIRMPKMDGVEATRHLAGPDVEDPVKVLILTTFDLDEYVYSALR